MNALKDNKFLTGLLVVTILGALGLGYLLYAAREKFTAALEAHSQLVGKKGKLEKEKPYPDEENADKVKGEVATFKAAADGLRQTMLRSQGTLPTGLGPTKFQENLRNRVEAVMQRASRDGVKLPGSSGGGSSSFYLGFEEYRSTPPIQAAAARLQYQLDAISWLMDELFAAGVRWVEVKRYKMDFEKKVEEQPTQTKGKSQKDKGDKKAEPEGPEACQFEVAFGVGPAGFQQVMNRITNTRAATGDKPSAEGQAPVDYYFVPRFIRVENEKREGPQRTQPEAPTEEEEADSSQPARTNNQQKKPASPEKINVAFGTESVRAYLALDLVRFEEPKKPESKKPAAKK